MTRLDRIGWLLLTNALTFVLIGCDSDEPPVASPISVNIQFSLDEEASVTLRIENSYGITIRTLLDQQTLAAGFHSIEWNTTTETPPLRRGVYFVRLSVHSETGQSTETRVVWLED